MSPFFKLYSKIRSTSSNPLNKKKEFCDFGNGKKVPSQIKEEALEYINEAFELFKLDLFDEAEESLNIAVKLDDTISDIYGIRALIKFATDRVDSALEDLDIAIKLNPNDPILYLHKALILSEKDDNESIKNFNIAEKTFIETGLPITTQFYISRGKTYLTIEEYQKAFDDFTTAIELDSDILAYFFRGKISNVFGDFESALNDLNSCIEQDSEFISAYVNRAFIHFKLKEYFDARSDLIKAIELEPELYDSEIIRDLLEKIDGRINYT